MFRSAVFKLTAWYVGALVIVCLLFSLPMYSVASSRLRRGAERQTQVVRDLDNTIFPDSVVRLLEGQRDKQLADDRHELLLTLMLINGIIVGVGGIASFMFARRTLKPIEDAHSAQTRFTADASHELRTPLAVMQTEIEVALRSKKLEESEARDILASNLEEVARLRNLSDQLLGLTRTDAESIKLNDTNLSKLVLDQIKLLSKRYKTKINANVAKGITVSLDKVLIAQVMGIIVENAVTYSGLDDPKITIKLVNNADMAILDISNMGKPIARKDLDKIFERFYRGPSATTHNPKGHGLGLALAKDIINRHDGQIMATSTKAGLTTFTIQLPLS